MRGPALPGLEQTRRGGFVPTGRRTLFSGCSGVWDLWGHIVHLERVASEPDGDRVPSASGSGRNTRGHVTNRAQLIDAAYGENIYVEDRTIDSHIKRLRKKFCETDKEFKEMETLYGVGYSYRDTATVASGNQEYFCRRAAPFGPP